MKRWVGVVAVVLGTSGSAAATTLTILDASSADVGRYASLAIGVDGLGLIAYQDDANGDLKVAHCSNLACTAATITTLDSVGDVGFYATLAIGADGRGLIAYYDWTQSLVKTAHCNDLACTSATLRVVEAAYANEIGLVIGSDGLPLLAYAHLLQLHTAHCTVPDCTTVTIGNVGSVLNVDQVRLAKGANGLGLVMVETRRPGPLDLRRCLNVACSATSPTQPPPSQNGFFELPRSAVVPPDGLPLIGYRYIDTIADPQILDVRMSRCADAACTAQVPTLSYTSVTGPDLALQSNGLGWFAYGENSGRLVLRQCTDAACTNTVARCAPADAVFHVSLERGSDGKSLTAFFGFQGVLGVAHDVSDPCMLMNIADTTVTEGPGVQANFAVSLTAPTGEPVTVAYTTADGTALAGADYVATSGTLTLPPGATSATIPVTILPDDIDESNETFDLRLSNAMGAVLADVQGTAMIVDDDPEPRMLAGHCERVEGNAGTQDCVLPVTLQGASAAAVTVTYTTQDGSATAGVDYVPTAGNLTFAPGAASTTVTVSILGDAAVEPDEDFTVHLAGAVNASILDADGEVTILDDDAPSLSSLELTHGSAVTADLAAQPGPVADQDYYRLSQSPFASYEVVADAVSGDVAPGLVLERLAEDNATVLQSGTAVGTGAAVSLRWERRLGFVNDRQHIRVRSAGCGTDCGADDTYRLRAYETTASIPRFNNGGTQVTVVLLQNTTDASVSAHLDFWDGGGTRRATQAVSLAAHALLVFNASTAPELAGLGGSITVTSDAPYGALAGKAVALEPATGFSFDSPLEYRPR